MVRPLKNSFFAASLRKTWCSEGTTRTRSVYTQPPPPRKPFLQTLKNGIRKQIQQHYFNCLVVNIYFFNTAHFRLCETFSFLLLFCEPKVSASGRFFLFDPMISSNNTMQYQTSCEITFKDAKKYTRKGGRPFLTNKRKCMSAGGCMGLNGRNFD